MPRYALVTQRYGPLPGASRFGESGPRIPLEELPSGGKATLVADPGPALPPALPVAEGGGPAWPGGPDG